MEEENKNIFDEVEGKETNDNEMNSVQMEVPTENNELKEEGFEIGEFSDNEKYEVQLAEGDGVVVKDGKVVSEGKEFIIDTVEIKKPMLQGADGFIEPMVLNAEKPDVKGYETKMHITYKDSNYKSVVSKITWYVGVNNDGKKVLNPWFPTNVSESDLEDQFTRTISKLYYRYCKHVGVEVGKVTQKEFVNGLVGKKVKLEQYSTKFKGSMRYRIDIKEFIQ